MSCCRRDSHVDGELFLSIGVSNSETQQGLESRRRWSQHKHIPWELTCTQSEHACTLVEKIYTEDLTHTVHTNTLTAGKQIKKVQLLVGEFCNSNHFEYLESKLEYFLVWFC